VSGGGQWADHVPRGCSRLISISRRWGWARNLPGRWLDVGLWSTGGRWTQSHAALSHAPIPDLTRKGINVAGLRKDYFPGRLVCAKQPGGCTGLAGFGHGARPRVSYGRGYTGSLVVARCIPRPSGCHPSDSLRLMEFPGLRGG